MARIFGIGPWPSHMYVLMYGQEPHRSVTSLQWHLHRRTYAICLESTSGAPRHVVLHDTSVQPLHRAFIAKTCAPILCCQVAPSCSKKPVSV